MREAVEAEVARTLVGLVLAREAQDLAAEAALRWGGSGPIGEEELLEAACRMIYDLAAALGEASDPPETAEEVLQAIALGVATDG